jgi:transcriptional regulator with XRE-family HTH domain
VVVEWTEAHWKALGQRIRAIREEKRLTQPELAARCGVPATRVSEIELGKRPGTQFSTIADIAAGLGVNVGVFLDDTAEHDRPAIVRFLGSIPASPLEIEPAQEGDVTMLLPSVATAGLDPSELFTVKMQTDELAADDLHKGDYVLVHTKRLPMEPGGLYLVRTAQAITVRHVYVEPAHVRLVAGGNMVTLAKDEVQIIGKVAGWGRWQRPP